MNKVVRILALALLFAVAASGCGCADSLEAVGLETPDAGEPACQGSGCAVATPGCPAAAIEPAGNEVCAACDGAAPICGVPDTAVCETRENARGQACELCVVADTGEILYQDCFSPDVQSSAFCEQTPLQGGASGDVVCEVCFDETGNTTSTACEPAHDSCVDVNRGGLACRECSQDGAVVFRTCQAPDLDPSFCQAYGNSAGRCVDCYGDGGALLSHACSLVSTAPTLSCAQQRSPDGVSCWVCTDPNGTPVSVDCQAAQDPPSRCELLSYTDQSCVVCVDDNNSPLIADCARNDCAGDPAGCEPPAPCQFQSAPDGSLCRVCPVEGTGTQEIRCVDDATLSCALENDASGQPCTVCNDLSTNLEVFRSCDAAAAPAYCADQVNGDGVLCSVCYDPSSDEALYAVCGDEVCVDIGLHPLQPDDNAAALGEVQCHACDRNAEGSSFIEDALVCTRTDAACLGSPLAGPEPTCSATDVLRVEPRGCQNPWDGNGAVPGPSLSEHLRVMTWAQTQAQVTLASVAADDELAAPAPNCQGCAACPRGDAFFVRFDPADRDAVVAAFERTIAP